MSRSDRPGILARVQFRVQRLDRTDSTSERLFAALEAGTARSGDVVVAREQTAGRGRRGRAWYSPAGEGLYLSVLVLPERSVAAPAWTMAGGLAVLDLVRELGVAEAALDWPNDVVVSGAKIAGVLAESRSQTPLHCVVGIGLDVAQRSFPPQLLAERAVTSLALEGVEIAADQLVDPLLRHLGPRLDAALRGGDALVAPFLAALGIADGPVHAATPAGPRTGRLVRLDLRNGLELATERGLERWALEHLSDLAPA